jgi:hypothetical protein
MSEPASVGETIEGIRQALLAAMRGSDVFSGVPVTDGPPLELRNTSAWVSYARDFTRKVWESTLKRGEITFRLGYGVSVSQMAGQDWSNIQSRLLELTRAAESIFGPQFGGDPTLGGLCLSVFLTEGQELPSLDDDSKPRLTEIDEITVVTYA